jgi:hypothetical protein
MANNWNYSWNGDYILKGDFNAKVDEDEMALTINDSPMHMDWQTQGVHEAVEVKAGSFPDALRVERETTLDISLKLASAGDAFTFDGQLKFKNTLWYDPVAGLLKEEVHDANIIYRGMTFPVVVTGDLELVEFRPAY